MKEIRTHRVGVGFVVADTPIILKETLKTRRVFMASFSVDERGTRHIRGRFYHQKKTGNSAWEEAEGLHLKDVKPGELASFELSTEEMGNLLVGVECFRETNNIASSEKRTEKFLIARSDEVIRTNDKEIRLNIDRLINGGHGKEFWSQLAELNPDEAERFADDQILGRRRNSVREFESAMRNGAWSELEWGKFFDRNRWIFGLGLRYQFLFQLRAQANYGGSDYTGQGAQKGDFLHYTLGDDAKFTVLVEIKRPDSLIFQPTAKEQKYRNGVPGFDIEFANALSQVQVNSHTWETGDSRNDENRDQLDRNGIYTVQPRSLLIYGNTSQLLDSAKKRNCFEIFRGQLKNTEIVTYDELLNRAKFIVGEMSGVAGPTG